MVALRRYYNYHPYGRYDLDVDSKAFSLTLHDDHKAASANCSGFGQERPVGLLTRRVVFVAIFVLNGELAILCDRELVIRDVHCRVERVTLFPFIKRFTLVSHERTIAEYVYWCTDDHGGMYGESDLFRFIAQEAQSRKRKARFVYFWSAKEKGQEITDSEFLREMDEYLTQF